VFTARYALSPCVKQTHSSFKWLILVLQRVGQDLESPFCPLYYRSLKVIQINLNGRTPSKRGTDQSSGS
jgi:hypothetical protein